MSVTFANLSDSGVHREAQVEALVSAAGSPLKNTYLPAFTEECIEKFELFEFGVDPYLVWTVECPHDSATRVSFKASICHPRNVANLWAVYKSRCPHLEWSAYDLFSYLCTHTDAKIHGASIHPTIGLTSPDHMNNDDVVLQLVVQRVAATRGHPLRASGDQGDGDVDDDGTSTLNSQRAQRGVDHMGNLIEMIHDTEAVLTCCSTSERLMVRVLDCWIWDI